MVDRNEQAEGGVLMVGSVPLADTDMVFRRICSSLPSRCRSIPDGETGERHWFCRWQHHAFPPEVIKKRPDLPENNEPVKERYTVESISNTGYDDAALASYADFLRLRDGGVIPHGVRFQVCVTTPFAVTLDLCKPDLVPRLEPLYEERFLQSIRRIVDNIRHEDLLIQWDLPFETLVLEYDRGAFTFPPLKMWFHPVLDGLLQRLTRINRAIPSEVPIGIHLCYGDADHKHIYEPKDTSFMVEFTHHLINTLGNTHHIEYVHMPVPRDRTDVEYVQALKSLRLPNHTRLCLGLVHAHDEAGTRKRIQVAKSVYPHSFAVATECGLGRTPPEDIDSIFEILEEVSQISS